jgi:hypothetical protein
MFAVIPVVVVPLAALAMFLTALLAWPLAAVRRWWAPLNVACACSALYVARFTFEGVCRRFAEADSWWARPVAFWLALSGVAGCGAAWVWCRTAAADRRAALKPGGGEKVGLAVLSLACVAVAVYRLWGRPALLDPSLVVAAAAWAGTLYALFPPRHAPTRLTAQGLALVALAVACAAYGLMGGSG